MDHSMSKYAFHKCNKRGPTRKAQVGGVSGHSAKPAKVKQNTRKPIHNTCVSTSVYIDTRTVYTYIYVCSYVAHEKRPKVRQWYMLFVRDHIRGMYV